jgi:putative nucleotidyltransferase with HDIG domain
MDRVPVVCLPTSAGRDVTASLARGGLLAETLEIRPDMEIPDAAVYVVADGGDLSASREWSRRAGAQRLARTVTLASDLAAGGVTILGAMGIHLACAAAADLPEAIGRVAPAVERAARHRLRCAVRTATAVLEAARATLPGLPSGATFDGTVCDRASRDHVERGAGASLFLMLDTFALEAEPTVRHCSTVAVVATALARATGAAREDQVRAFLAGFFHDVGKLTLPSVLIEKPTRLTDAEMRLMRSHVTAGYEILRRHPGIEGGIADAALSHHEYLDGTGYPHGLEGGDIPLLTRIVTIADIFSALVERRSYKEPIPAEEAYAMLRGMAGKLDPELVAAFRPVALAAAAPA